MQSTAYLGTKPFQKNLPYRGGLCAWWLTPWQNIASWPIINPATQLLATPPTLKPNTTWYGPIEVPNHLLSLTITQEEAAAGTFYKTTLGGTVPGTNAAEYVNLQNIAQNQWAVLGKLRAGGHLILLGTPNIGMQYKGSTNIGSAADAANDAFTLTIQTHQKPPLLNAFNVQPNTPPQGAITPPTIPPAGVRPMETIYFTNQATVQIPWTPQRQNTYGAFPIIEVWITDATGQSQQIQPVIMVDAAPPNATLFTIDISGNATGFIIIK